MIISFSNEFNDAKGRLEECLDSYVVEKPLREHE